MLLGFNGGLYGPNGEVNVFQSSGAPSPSLGSDNDLCFDLANDVLYQKQMGSWVIAITFSGGSGGSGDSRYEQSFTAASVVTVNHNLGKKPSPTIFDSSGDEIEAAVKHNSVNTMTLTFSAPFTGTVTCN